jgi:hypothetical protein
MALPHIRIHINTNAHLSFIIYLALGLGLWLDKSTLFVGFLGQLAAYIANFSFQHNVLVKTMHPGVDPFHVTSRVIFIHLTPAILTKLPAQAFLVKLGKSTWPKDSTLASPNGKLVVIMLSKLSCEMNISSALMHLSSKQRWGFASCKSRKLLRRSAMLAGLTLRPTTTGRDNHTGLVFTPKRTGVPQRHTLFLGMQRRHGNQLAVHWGVQQLLPRVLAAHGTHPDGRLPDH